MAAPTANQHIDYARRNPDKTLSDEGSIPSVSTTMPTNYATIPPIYIVTTLVVHEDGSRKSRRTWGWHPTLADARHAVSTNDADIFENDYNYAVVEEAYPGSMTLCEKRWWFRVVRDAERDPGGALRGWYAATGAEECEEPEWARLTINFGIG